MLGRVLKLTKPSGWNAHTYINPKPKPNPESNNGTLEIMDFDDLLDNIPLPPSASTPEGSNSKTHKGRGKEKAIEDILDEVELDTKPGKKNYTKDKAKASDAFVSERKKAQVRFRVKVGKKGNTMANAKASDTLEPKSKNFA